MTLVSLLDLENIGDVLRERRKDLEGTENYLSGTAMSKILREQFGKAARSQAWISLVEVGGADIMALHPEVRLELLKLYNFSEEELETLNERFSLKLPLARKTEYLNNLGSTPEFSAIVVYSAVLNAGAEVGLPVPRAILESAGVNQEDCEVLLIDNNVLMPEPLRAALPAGTYMLLTAKLSPKENSYQAYRCGEKFVVLQNDGNTNKIPVMNADGSEGEFLNRDDARLEYLGVNIGRFSYDY